MATTYTIRKGESLAMVIPVLDESGQAIDISTSTTTNVLVTLSNKGTVFAKYSLIDMGADWGDLTTSTNLITILATREESKLWETGFASATITVEQDDITLTHKVDDFEIGDFLTILNSVNASYVLTHA